MKQKMKPIKFNPIMLSRKGAGRVDDSRPITLTEYIPYQITEPKNREVTCYVPRQIKLSEEIHGTVYDVTGVFDQTVDKSLLRQFQDIILSQEKA